MSNTYRVTGPHAWRGHAPGSTFEAELSEDQEARAIARGSIAVEAPDNLDSLTREQLNELAEKAGVADPSSLDNKDAVIDAIKASENTEEE